MVGKPDRSEPLGERASANGGNPRWRSLSVRRYKKTTRHLPLQIYRYMLINLQLAKYFTLDRLEIITSGT